MGRRPPRRGILTTIPNAAAEHAFVHQPHRTFLGLSFPVMLSLIAEPLTGAVDTAFLARLGAAPVAALGVATSLLSSLFWVFNFLGVGTQTEVGQGLAEPGSSRARDACGLALGLSVIFGTGFGLLALPLLGPAVEFMSDDSTVQAAATSYLTIRLLGGPAVLITISACGALRGLQDMRTPLWIAVVVNLLNIALDVMLIFGAGPIPPLGVAGAAWAATVSQWLGAIWAAMWVTRRLGWPTHLPWAQLGRLLRAARDLGARTGLLLLFLFIATRQATLVGADSGAAHQAMRQIWMLSALVLDAFAMTAQSLIAYFLAAGHLSLARRVTRIACLWGLAVGVLLCVAMLLGRDAIAGLLVPASARGLLPLAWAIAAYSQPLNALSFVTDGIHWGTGDYAYLRNAMLIATLVGSCWVLALPSTNSDILVGVWGATALWIGIRAGFGIARIWPGIGASPLRSRPNAHAA
ncbi:MATE family efflux transporter [Myxococcota bacterium]|nr:MATE family efflux transporter [Myxococcota bacterium]